MSKAKLYKIDNNGKFNNNDLYSFIISIVIYAVVLMIASFLFRGIYVENFFYAIIAALILSFLNVTVKPLIVYFTLPLSIMSFGLAYPIVNVIILNICDILMGKSFEMGGLLSSFIIAIFISWLKISLDRFVERR